MSNGTCKSFLTNLKLEKPQISPARENLESESNHDAKAGPYWLVCSQVVLRTHNLSPAVLDRQFQNLVHFG